MKKSSSRRKPTTMKKKTNSAIKKQRIQRQKVKASMKTPLPPIDNTALMTNLEQTESACRSMLATSLSVSELLKNKEAISKLSNPSEVAKMAQVYVADIQRYNEQLTEISESAKTLRNLNVNDNTDVLLQSITVGQAYQEWIESYQNVVVPMQLDIHEAFAAIVDTPSTANGTPE